MECIILAGGMGTRLADAVSDRPKCLADINEKPFLDYLIQYLESQGVESIILSLGYRHEQVIDWLKGKSFFCKISWVIEKEPLGTGGALKLALQKSKQNKVLLVNGDTLFKVPLKELYEINDQQVVTLSLKSMKNFDRYGAVMIDEEKNILSFEEKKWTDIGLINGGVYLINKSLLNLASYPQSFSFENDYLVSNVSNLNGYESDAYFIDIGIPEDYNRAKIDFVNFKDL